MKRNLFYLFLVSISLLGLGLSLWFAWQLPLWLDEKYSLYFAGLYSPMQLLVASPDTHPGLFYVLTKTVVPYITDVWMLRVVLGVLPQWIGGVIVVSWMLKKQLSQRSILLSALFLFLNPFVIYTTAQIRMYGVVAFFSLLTFVCFQVWKEKPNASRFTLLLAAILTGCSVSYSLFFVALGILVFMMMRSIEKKKNIYQPILLAAALPAAFLILAGSSVKQTFEWGASWIPMPSFTSIPSLFWTTVGVDTNLFMQSVPFGIGTALFYGVIAYVFLGSRRLRLREVCIRHREIVCILFLPILFILLISFAFPLLSQRFFFYQFLPKLSLFLPRVFLPLVLFASSYIASMPFTQSRRRIVVATVMVFLWAGTYLSYSRTAAIDRANSVIQDTVATQVQQLDDSVREEVIWLPSWARIHTMTPDKMSVAGDVGAYITRAEKVEDNLFSQSKSNHCDTLRQQYVVVNAELAAESVRSYYRDAEAILDVCCQRQQKSDFKLWYCK